MILFLDAFILFLKVFLATVLVAAGAAKFADLPGFITTLIGLGVPSHRDFLLRGIGFTVPLLEVTLGIMLVVGVWPEVINLLTLGLTLFFTAITTIALVRGFQVTCRCFGALSESQFNRRGLTKTLILTLIAFTIAYQGATSQQQFQEAPGSTALLVVAYAIFIIAVIQAAKTTAMFRERYQS